MLPKSNGERKEGGHRRILSLLFLLLSLVSFLFLRWVWRTANERAQDGEQRGERPAPGPQERAEADVRPRTEGSVQPDISPHVHFVRERGHEGLDVNVRYIAIFAVALVVVAVILHVVLWGLLDLFAEQPLRPGSQDDPMALSTQLPPPEPRLQQDPGRDLRQLHATEEAMLNRYQWLDQDEGVARIPIERAMSLLIENGFPRATPTPEAELTATTPSDQTGTPAAESEEIGAMVAAGEELFQSLGCIGCHLQDGSGSGPSLVNVFGSPRPLESGETVIADEEYIRRSILRPEDQIVAGYDPLMPSFAGELDNEEIEQLIAYIQSLSEGES